MSPDRLNDVRVLANSAENSRNLAEMWGDFVGWEGRRRGENGFLVRMLHAYGVVSVLDVALGDGVDTIYLLGQGFNVSCNEVDDAFRAKAVDNAKGRGFDITPTALDWRDLDRQYQKESFDAVLCYGNSLTVLQGRENQLKVLCQFHQLLKPGGGAPD